MTTQIETTHMVLPADTNPSGNCFGGTLMSWMDLCSAICATRYCCGPCVTVSVDDLQFNKPIKLGDIVVIKASVNWTGKTSMEIGVRVERQTGLTLTNSTPTMEHALSGYFSFVALDEDTKKPKAITVFKPSNQDESRRHQEAQCRREYRLKKKQC